ncbi:MAG: hypothetical protein E7262_05435 [Lachnospiraceae bacterium]|nr:hypothetical protein [Lachnospiraceae bacterium]
MRSKLFKVVSTIFAAMILLLSLNLLLSDIIAKNKIVWLDKVLDIAFMVSVILLILSTIVAAIFSIRDCIRKEGRQYVDKFLLKVVCIFVLLFVFRYSDKNYMEGVVYPALIWIVVPRAYDYITSNEQ